VAADISTCQAQSKPTLWAWPGLAFLGLAWHITKHSNQYTYIRKFTYCGAPATPTMPVGSICQGVGPGGTSCGDTYVLVLVGAGELTMGVHCSTPTSVKPSNQYT
jgi:hypothetical protein